MAAGVTTMECAPRTQSVVDAAGGGHSPIVAVRRTRGDLTFVAACSPSRTPMVRFMCWKLLGLGRLALLGLLVELSVQGVATAATPPSAVPDALFAARAYRSEPPFSFLRHGGGHSKHPERAGPLRYGFGWLRLCRSHLACPNLSAGTRIWAVLSDHGAGYRVPGNGQPP
jgi:hypothetical protein